MHASIHTYIHMYIYIYMWINKYITNIYIYICIYIHISSYCFGHYGTSASWRCIHLEMPRQRDPGLTGKSFNRQKWRLKPAKMEFFFLYQKDGGFFCSRKMRQKKQDRCRSCRCSGALNSLDTGHSRWQELKGPWMYLDAGSMMYSEPFRNHPLKPLLVCLKPHHPVN